MIKKLFNPEISQKTKKIFSSKKQISRKTRPHPLNFKTPPSFNVTEVI
eukprot:UN01295